MPAAANDTASLAVSLNQMSVDDEECIENCCFNCGHMHKLEPCCDRTTDRTYQARYTAWFVYETARRQSEREGLAMPADVGPAPERPNPRSPDHIVTPIATPPPLPPPPPPPPPPPAEAAAVSPDPVPTLDWTPDVPTPAQGRTPAQRSILRRYALLAATAKPAVEDPLFRHIHVRPGDVLPRDELDKLLRVQGVVLLTGCENWEGRPRSLKTLEEQGVAADPKRVYSFTSMNVLAAQLASEKKLHGDARMDDEIAAANMQASLYTKMTFREYFARPKNDLDVLNLLELSLPGYRTPSHLRAFYTRTVAHFIILGGDAKDMISVQRSEMKEEAWALVSDDGSFSAPHHDAGHRGTHIGQKLGEKLWNYFRPNEAGEKLLAQDPEKFMDMINSYDAEEMSQYGTWYYVRLKGGMELLQPSWLWHAVRTVKWSVTAGSHFDLLTFALWEKCMKEEHVTGLRSTNAERHAWWSTLVNFARSLSLDPMETDRLVLPDGDLFALRRMVLNPCAYVPQQPRGDASERTNADLHLLSFHLVAKEVRMILENKSKKNARKEIEKWFTNNTKPKTVFPPDHDERVRAACEAANNITALMSARTITVDKDKEKLASHLWSD